MASTDVATFGAVDYVVFALMLLVSLAIGIFYAIKDRKSKEGVQGYLLAARQMSFIPVAISLNLSFVSAVTVLGVPAEIYFFGPMYLWFILAAVWVVPVVTEIFIRTFYRLQLTSAFEYIELRFNRVTRLLATSIYIIQNIMYIGIMIYAPALALSSVTNFNLWGAVASIGIVCTLYTTFGGLKAVIWTDVFQGCVLLIVMIVTMIMSANAVGGFGKVWEACYRGGRIDFVHFETDPRVRNTFWSMVVGLGFLWLSVFGTSQSQVQRYLCCKSEWEAKKGLIIGVSSAMFLLVISVLTGFVTYAYFETCDPFLSRSVSAPDQILPYMILRIYKNQPGMPGLFVAGLFAGCLSTVSSGINAMACVTVKDFLQPFVNWSPKVMTSISKGMVLTYGALCIGFAFLASSLGGVLQASLSVLGMVGGPLLGLFSLGMMFPCANSSGGIVGLISGIALVCWIYIGATLYPSPPTFTNPKSLNTSGCPAPAVENVTVFTVASEITTQTAPFLSNITEALPSIQEVPAIADLYHVSYAYYAAIGFGTTVLLGLIVSFIANGFTVLMVSRGYLEDIPQKELDPRLIVPVFDHLFFRWLPLSFRKMLHCGVKHEKPPRDENRVVPATYKEVDPDTGLAKVPDEEVVTVSGKYSLESEKEGAPNYHELYEVKKNGAVESKASSRDSQREYSNMEEAQGEFNPAYVADETSAI